MVFLLLGLLSLLYIPVPSKTLFWKAVYNFGHVPLFGCVAILLLWVSRTFIKRPGGQSLQHYSIALWGVLVLALLTESLQLLTVTRSFTLSDVIHDLVGAVCGLMLFLTYDSDLLGRWVEWREFPRNAVLRVTVVLVLALTLLPVMQWAYACWDRDNRFPSLVEFSSEWEMKFVKAVDSEWQVVEAPEGWKKSRDDLVGQVVFHPKRYPRIHLEEPYPDWRGYTFFQLDVYSELSSTQSIAIRIDDTYRTTSYENRFNRRIMISPGLNHIQIPLEDIRQAPESREMDMSSIRKVLLFAVSPPKEFILYFDNLRLE